MGCGCTGCGVGGKGGSIALVAAVVVAAGLMGASVFGFSSDDSKKDDAKKDAPAAQPAAKADDKKAAEEKPAEKPDPFVLRYVMKDIDGSDQNLEQYKGKVVLIVNVASECGFTPQYKGLQALYESRKDKGLVILGFPANNFGSQEPGKNEEIKAFCTSKYAVTFPMFSKVSVKGEDAEPLFKQLAANAGAPTWNFNKYLVDRTGNVVQRFAERVKPDDATLVGKIDELLGK